VYETSSRRGGYVTCDGDAHRLRSAMERLHLPECEARLFDAGAVLWLSETSVCAERVRALRILSGCSIYMIYTKRPGKRLGDVCRWQQRQPAEEGGGSGGCRAAARAAAVAIRHHAA
jgi:hypothetical protein